MLEVEGGVKGGKGGVGRRGRQEQMLPDLKK